MMASFEAALPIEKWQQVMTNISPGDLCNVMLTSRHMNSMASWPKLWAGMKVNMKMVRENGLAQLYSINRFNKIKQINVNALVHFNSVELEKLLNDIHESPLEDISFSGINLNFSGVSADLLTSAFSGLKTVSFSNTNFTTNTWVNVLEAINFSTTLVHMKLINVDLSQVSPDLLASLICHLQTIDLSRTSLTTAQCIVLLEAIISSTTLVSVKLLDVDLSEVSPDLLAGGIKRLETVSLNNTRLTTSQCIKVLEASYSSKTLLNLDLAYVDLSRVPPYLLGNAISCLDFISLASTNLTTDQCIQALEASLSANKPVNLHFPSVNLSSVPPSLLANEVSRRTTVNLDHAILTTQQCAAILEASLTSTTLTDVSLTGVDLSGVHPELLSKAVKRLKTAALVCTSLTTDQCVEILKSIPSSTTLCSVHFHGNQILPDHLRYLLTSLPPHIEVKGLN